MTRRRYFILDETCPEREVQSMMGRVVLDPAAPLHAFAPMEPLNDKEVRHNPEDIIPTILPEPSLSTKRLWPFNATESTMVSFFAPKMMVPTPTSTMLSCHHHIQRTPKSSSRCPYLAGAFPDPGLFKPSNFFKIVSCSFLLPALTNIFCGYVFDYVILVSLN